MTTAASDSKSYDKLQELVRDIDVAMITTVTVDGTLRSRPMATRQFEPDGTLWFLTSDDSGKAHDLEEEHAVNVSYAEPGQHRYISITGNATIVHDSAKTRELWNPRFKTYLPRGLEDPHLALMKVRIESAEYWDASRSRMVQLYELTSAVTGETPDVGEHTKVDVRAARESG